MSEEKLLESNRFDFLYDESKKLLVQGDFTGALLLAQRYLENLLWSPGTIDLFSEIYEKQGDVYMLEIYKTASKFLLTDTIQEMKTELKIFIDSDIGNGVENVFWLKNHLSLLYFGHYIFDAKYHSSPMNWVSLLGSSDMKGKFPKEDYKDNLSMDFLYKPNFLHEYFEVYRNDTDISVLYEVFKYEEMYYSSTMHHKSSYHKAYLLLSKYAKTHEEKYIAAWKASLYEDVGTQEQTKKEILKHFLTVCSKRNFPTPSDISPFYEIPFQEKKSLGDCILPWIQDSNSYATEQYLRDLFQLGKELMKQEYITEEFLISILIEYFSFSLRQKWVDFDLFANNSENTELFSLFEKYHFYDIFESKKQSVTTLSKDILWSIFLSLIIFFSLCFLVFFIILK